MKQTGQLDGRGPTFRSYGYVQIEDFLDSHQCRRLLDQINTARERQPPPEIHRPARPVPLRYWVIDGDRIRQELPEIWRLYQEDVLRLVTQLSGEDLAPLANQQVSVNINIMAPGLSTYRWHYDRCQVTAILYLNEVEGGETVLYPNLRFLLAPGRPAWLQRWLDWFIQLPLLRSLFSRKTVVHPQAGRLVVMRGDRCWHSVRPLHGDQERICIVLAYDRPGASFAVDANLDRYLYTRQEVATTDPNYVP